MKKLTVVYHGWGERWTLGTLADNGRALLFEYSPEALRQGLELSPLHLELREPAYHDFPDFQMRLPGLIADALPDGWGLLLMDKLFRKQGRNPARMSPLDRLAFVDGRAMGALVFEPADTEALEPADVALLQLAREVRALVSDESTEALRKLAVMGGSPQGARPKVLVNYDAARGRVTNNEAGEGTPWLIKFQAGGEHKDACAVEALYARLATECAIEMPKTRYFDLDKKLAAFGTERFDRRNGLRVPMHTVAGALHANFRMPSSVDYTTLLRLTRRMTWDEREVVKAYARCAFNVLFNNRDDHPRNASFCLGQDRRWRLSPAYDLTYCEGPGGEHHMDICGEGKAPSSKELLKLAKDGGVPEAAALAVIGRIAQVASRFKTYAGDFALRKTTLAQIHSAVTVNLARLR